MGVPLNQNMYRFDIGCFDITHIIYIHTKHLKEVATV